MNRNVGAAALIGLLLSSPVALAAAEQASQATTARKVRVTGIVKDESNNITLPGIPVEVAGAATVYTDVDGRFLFELPPGTHEIKVAMEGYDTQVIKVVVPAGARVIDANVALQMSRFAETVTVTADAFLGAVTSSAEAQMVERKAAPVITDNLGSQEMKKNADSDAAAAMSRVTGLSVVDNQYVFVRGLGERYSNTTLSGSTLPTTEPDKKVVPLDLFPAGLLDSVQVSKSYSPDRSAEFAGGLVQINPLKFPSRAVMSFSYGLSGYSTATGKSIPLSPLNGRDFLGFDNGLRALPGGIPGNKVVRRGIYTPDVGYTPEQITEYGRQLGNTWSPTAADGAPGQNWGAVFGNRFGKVGVVTSFTQSYKEQYVEEQRAFYRIGDDDELEAVSDYDMKYGTQRAQIGAVANFAYQMNSNNRISLENFYSHSGKDEGRTFEGPNTENVFYYRNSRLAFVEEGLLSTALSGDHFFPGASNSRIDWRVNLARANRDEPDLRETLYQQPFRSGTLEPNPAVRPVLADESQSGFRLFQELDDETLDLAANYAAFKTTGARPTQFKFGVNYVERTRDFSSRRFRFIPIVATKDGASPVDLTQTPEQLYTSNNIGTAFRFNEETRPVDAYNGEQTTMAGYGMMDMTLSARSRLIAGARVENFEQTVNTFDPFGLFQRTITAENKNTDIFPSVNFVQSVGARQNIRLGYSTTVNRPEFRELAEFEFTDVVGSRATRGNPNLKRALIQNVDARWELFPGGRSIVSASTFFKYFDQPIERVVIAAANPITTFQNADKARNFGLEFETAFELGGGFFMNANYTYVDSKITLLPEQQTVQTSLERSLAGQSNNLFNLTGEFARGGFSVRGLVNFVGDRISDVGSNGAPDIVEQGRATVDLVLLQRFGSRYNLRFSVENLTDAEYLFNQGSSRQRSYKLGQTYGFSFGVDVF
ncbi:MAG: TonB-dependent receptor [Acidobacteriota bacterium]|nr:TonB-dependent receptor [Acidobacteriota bacterium]